MYSLNSCSRFEYRLLQLVHSECVFPSNTLPVTPEASSSVFVSLTERKHRTMSGIKLIYFNLMGRAEVTRLILAQAGVSYEDKRIEMEE